MLIGDAIVDILEDEGVSHLHHTNTSATALSFLINGALLSRQYIKENPTISFQTIQKSDKIDQECGIYNDIFFDAENIWEKSINFYGPVVFRYSLNVLLGKRIRITADNPQHWVGISETGRYLTSVDDVKRLCTGRKSWPWGNHIVLPNTEKLNFTCLDNILLYSPAGKYVGDERNDPSKALAKIKEACATLGICFVEKQFQGDSYKASIFYGFTSKVPQALGCCS